MWILKSHKLLTYQQMFWNLINYGNRVIDQKVLKFHLINGDHARK